MKFRGHLAYTLFMLTFICSSRHFALQQVKEPAVATDLKKLSLEELLTVEITVASRKPQSYWQGRSLYVLQEV